MFFVSLERPRKLLAPASQFVYTVAPAGAYRLRPVLRRPEPYRADGKSREPQYPPSELCIDVPGEEAHEERVRAARHDDTRGFAPIQPMPEERASAAFHFHIAEGGAG